MADEANANANEAAMAAARAAASVASQLMSPIFFHGEGKVPAGETGCSPKDFLITITARRKGNTWTDVQTFAAITAALRGKAHDWYYDYQLTVLPEAEYTTFTTDFIKGFVPEFKECYGLKSEKAGLIWRDLLHQKRDENVIEYIARLATGLREHYRNRINKLKDTKTVFAEAALDGIATIPVEEVREVVKAEIGTHRLAAGAEMKRIIINEMVEADIKEMCLAGLRSTMLREKAYEMSRDEPDMKGFATNLVALARRLHLMEAGSGAPSNGKNNGNGNSNGNGKNGNGRNKVHEVDIDTNSDDIIEDIEVEAVGGAKKKQNGAQSKTKPRGDRAGSAGGGSKWCYFCKAAGHVNRECEKKKKHMADKAANGGASAISAHSEQSFQTTDYFGETSCLSTQNISRTATTGDADRRAHMEKTNSMGTSTISTGVNSAGQQAQPEQRVHIGGGFHMNKSAVSQVQNFKPAGNVRREW